MRSFTWAHSRQLDRVSGGLLARARSAGAGRGDEPVTVDVDSTIRETYGLAKQGGMFGHIHVRRYHPLLATIAGTGDVVRGRLRGDNANSGRGAKSFLTETFNRIRAAGATGPMTLRADSGFYARNVVDACHQTDVRFSITVRLHKRVRNTIVATPDDAWTPILYFLDDADVTETTYRPFANDQPDLRLILRRVRPRHGTQLALFFEFTYHAIFTDQTGAVPALEADHRRHAESKTPSGPQIRRWTQRLGSSRFGTNTAWLVSTSSRTTCRAGPHAWVPTNAHHPQDAATPLPARLGTAHPLGPPRDAAPAPTLARGPSSSSPRSRTCAQSCSSLNLNEHQLTTIRRGSSPRERTRVASAAEQPQ